MSQITANLIMNPKPPTLYSIMNSIANYDKTEKTKIRDLAGATHNKIFDFNYNLSEALDKDEFEINILNHFIMRRIGFDTFTAFQIFLENKLKEILPYYNLMFDSFKNYNLFNGGEVITRTTVDNKNMDTSGNSDSESRFSEYPLNELNDINDGSYVSNQTTVKSNVTNNTTEDNTTNENITRTPIDKMAIYRNYLETKRSVMSMIYKELEILFYGIAD
ncbi:hypothetical protein J6W34_04765 [bacterium]|nr:hypothetical protein [bacterium]